MCWLVEEGVGGEVGVDGGPEAEAGHPLASLLYHQRLPTVVGHIEPNALILTYL